MQLYHAIMVLLEIDFNLNIVSLADWRNVHVIFKYKHAVLAWPASVHLHSPFTWGFFEGCVLWLIQQSLPALHFIRSNQWNTCTNGWRGNFKKFVFHLLRLEILLSNWWHLSSGFTTNRTISICTAIQSSSICLENKINKKCFALGKLSEDIQYKYCKIKQINLKMLITHMTECVFFVEMGQLQLWRRSPNNVRSPVTSCFRSLSKEKK